MTPQEKGFSEWLDTQPTFGVDPDVVWDAACAWQREYIADMFSYAIKSDLENGVKWLNENAYSEFTREYKEINKLFGKLNKGLFDDNEKA
jgi:hypothetical protein